jgi:flagellar biosynthetic protein FlhB
VSAFAVVADRRPTSAFDPSQVHLQWFAAEDEGRTEDPTEQKLRKAREDGKVARSPDLPSSLVLLFGIVALAVLGNYILKTLDEMLHYFFVSSTTMEVVGAGVLSAATISYLVRLVLPVASIAFVAALFGNVIQVGFLFTTKPITPDFSRIVPRLGRFLRRSIFSVEAGFNLGKSLTKVGIIGLIAYFNISAEIPRLATMLQAPLVESITLLLAVAFRIAIESAIALLIMSLPDYFFQRRQHRESLKMSRQEVKEERRQYEGDPLVRSRLRERMRDLLSRNMLREVPRADVVITNPTHYAIALQWDRVRMDAPTVLAKGVDIIAARIREVADENAVPRVENKPLARALYAEVEIGDTIPEKFYEVIATILAQIYSAAEDHGTAAATANLAGPAAVLTGGAN